MVTTVMVYNLGKQWPEHSTAQHDVGLPISNVAWQTWQDMGACSRAEESSARHITGAVWHGTHRMAGHFGYACGWTIHRPTASQLWLNIWHPCGSATCMHVRVASHSGKIKASIIMMHSVPTVVSCAHLLYPDGLCMVVRMSLYIRQDSREGISFTGGMSPASLSTKQRRGQCAKNQHGNM